MKTKRFFRYNTWYLMLMMFVMMGVQSCENNKTDTLNDWIDEAKKPILVFSKPYISNYSYTFIDADGVVFFIGPTSLMFPDTIY